MATVLVADDAPLVRRICSQVLAASGFAVLEASDGLEAVALYRDQGPDVVLLDIAMPKLDGIGALEEIMRIDPNARVAMLTGNRREAEVRAAIAAGARDFVAKPFELARLLTAVRNLLGPNLEAATADRVVTLN